jgi:hypothetical protein
MSVTAAAYVPHQQPKTLDRAQSQIKQTAELAGCLGLQQPIHEADSELRLHLLTELSELTSPGERGIGLVSVFDESDDESDLKPGHTLGVFHNQEGGYPMLIALLPLIICGLPILQVLEVQDEGAEDALKISKEGEEN